MQKIATRVFIGASIMFGFFGILMVLTSNFDGDSHPSDLNQVIQKCFMISIFIILPAFALSVASKYLNGKS